MGVRLADLGSRGIKPADMAIGAAVNRIQATVGGVAEQQNGQILKL
jgi:hypothetical protein